MTAGTVVLLRHGQTPWNEQRRLQGNADIDLNDLGREQAEQAAGVLAELRPKAIVSSDLRRASDTARIVARASGVSVRIDKRLRERGFGPWEGLGHAEIEEGWPEQYRLWVGGGQPDGLGIEPRRAVGQRVAAAVDTAALTLAQADVLVIVSHGAAIGTGLTFLLGLDPTRWNGISGLGNCHWSIVHPTNSGHPRWRLVAHNVGVPR